MSFSKDQLKAFITQVNTKGGESMFWTPKDGTTRIRFFTSPKEKNPTPFFQMHRHWYQAQDGTRKTIVCTTRTEGLGTTTQPCPICAYVRSLYNSKKATLVEAAQQLRTSRQFVQWAFVKNPDEDKWTETPVLACLSKTLITQILEASMMSEDGEDCDLFDVTQGNSITISRRKGEGQFQYIYTVVPNRPFPLTGEPFKTKIEETESILAHVKIPTPEEQNEAMEQIRAWVESSHPTIDTPEDDGDDENDDAIRQASSIAKMLGQSQ